MASHAARIVNSLKSPSGSMFSSILLHAALAGGVVWMAGHGFFKSDAPVTGEIDLGYETLDEPPAPEKVEQKLARTPEPVAPAAPKDLTPPIAQELQDQSSDIAGRQAEAKPVASTGATSDGVAAATPFYKIKPKYPKAALMAGTEGWVMLKIDIDEGGEVSNVRVVDGEQRNLFENEARRAVEKWKYRPFTDGSGQPVKKADHQVRVDFKLQEA